MRLLRLHLAVALIHFGTLILAIPSTQNGRLPSHPPRVDVDTVSFRVRATPIVLTLTVSQLTNQEPIRRLLLTAYQTVWANQQHQGLGLVPGGEFEQKDSIVTLRMWNADNHQ